MKKYILPILIFVLLVFEQNSSYAQTFQIKGTVISPAKVPIEKAVISITETGQSAETDKDGNFELTLTKDQGQLSISAPGYYTNIQPIQGREKLIITLVPTDKSRYDNSLLLPFETMASGELANSPLNINRKDMPEVNSIENAIQGKIPGLNIINKSGMPGEGSYMNIHGIHSFIGNNSPLVILNGVPYLPNMTASSIIGGYSQGIFNALDINNIQNISILTGAEASIYGSLGSNGVILIETNGTPADNNLNTQISFSAQTGVKWNNRHIPVLGVDAYKSYIEDVGMTTYDDMDDLESDYPYLVDDPDYYYSYRYDNNTNWQDEIYNPSITTDDILRIQGGDAIAKYDISLGYMRDAGSIDQTKQERYHTQINTNIMVNRRLKLFTTVQLAYMEGKFQEQGMLESTNPTLTAYLKSPLLSPYAQDEDGNLLDSYSSYYDDVSNPLAIINTLDATNKQYDVHLLFGLNEKMAPGLTLTGTAALYYNYITEDIFIPGVTNTTIMPQSDGLADNTVRSGVGVNKNFFGTLYMDYKKEFEQRNQWKTSIGIQWLKTNNEYDAGSGYNTASDSYETLDYVDDDSREFYGYIKKWNWMNLFLRSIYTYHGILKTSVNMSVDGSSSSGTDASRFYYYPSVGLTLMAKNFKSILNNPAINQLNFKVNAGLTGNSQFSSNYGKYYYESAQFLELSGVVRAGLPNTDLTPEKNFQFSGGFDFEAFRHHLTLSANYYFQQNRNLLFPQSYSSVGGSSVYYDNTAKINNTGLDLSFRLTPILNSNFELSVGGNISFPHSKIITLGDDDEYVTTSSDDDGEKEYEIINRKDHDPYCFYGLVSEGIFSSTSEADEAGLYTEGGDQYTAGDVHFQDVNNDNVINDEDKQILGSPIPDYCGGFNLFLRVHQFSLSLDFTYSKGNEAYNAVLRSIESVDDFVNQSQAVTRRWQYEGQQTDIPRANYEDPLDNNAFSSRWIEDASFLKLKTINLSYNFDKSFLSFIQSGTIFCTAENVLCWTNYSGLDPEFSYSFDEAKQGIDFAKAVVPHYFKFGFNLNF